MSPHIKIFLKQTRRGTKRLVLQLVLLFAAVAFFVVSLNLYSNSTKNLQTVEDLYTTIATMEFYGYVDKMGDLVHPGDPSSVGRHWLSVEDYDLSPLLALDSVKSIDVRTRVGAYIPGQRIVISNYEKDPVYAGSSLLYSPGSIIRFTLDSEKPMEISLQKDYWQYLPFPIQIIETSSHELQYTEEIKLCITTMLMEDAAEHQEDIRRLNRSEVTDRIILHPGVEYILYMVGGDSWVRDPETGVYTCQRNDRGLQIAQFHYYLDDFLYHRKQGIQSSAISNISTVLQSMPFALQRYEDIKNDPVWQECSQAAEYDNHSFAAILTGDISMIPAWYQDAMYLQEGRMITEKEYKNGAKVCMISAQMAEYQGWQVGDKLDMHLYAYDAFCDQSSVIIQTAWDYPQNYIPPPYYLKDNGGFFEEDQYEIVGIFGIREFTDFGETAPEVFYNPWNAIYIPANAAPDAPEGPIQPSLLTIELKNGSIDEFKAAVEEMGLTNQVPGEYEIKFSYFDQGYSTIQPGLMEMNRNAKLLLGLSAVLLLVTMILMAFLFSRQHKHSAGILRMLGGSKQQAFTAILVCAAVIVVAGGVIGTILGGVLTQSVGASTLGDVTSTTVTLATGANPLLTVLSGMGCMALFLALTALFTATYISKEPRALLPQDKG